MSEGALSARIDGIEKRLDRGDEYRHDMRGEIAKTGTEVAVIHTEVNGIRQDLDEHRTEVRRDFDELKKSSAAAVDQRSSRRFQVALAVIGPIIGSLAGGAVAVVLLGGHV